MLDKLVGVNSQVSKGSMTLVQSIYTTGIVIEGIGSMDVLRVYTPLDPDMDMSTRQDDEEKLDISGFPYAKIFGNLILW